MRSQEAGILADGVYYVGRYHSLVVLSFLQFAQGEEALDDINKKRFFSFNIHGTRDGSNRPAKLVQICPRPF
jgi:hypothetical protein